MKPIEFEEQNIVFAKDQPEYQPLPAYRQMGKTGNVVTCWEFSDEEMEVLKTTKKLWISIYTFNQPLQPILPSINKSDVL